MFTVYVLYSEKFDKIYTGYTNHLPSRLQSHNSEKNSGYTKRFQPWKVVYTEEHKTKTMAMLREKQLKSGRGREFIRVFIEQKKQNL
jgi:putative endonuclease